MDVKNAIEKRRSIRKYKDKDVPEYLIKQVIDAARLAPSGNNAQPSRYFIIKDDETKKMLKKNKIFMQGFVYEAPVTIVCCADPHAYKKSVTGFDMTNDTRAIRDLSIAASFLVLRATELGLGTCFVGWVDKEKIKDVLNIPKEYIVPYVITLGYPDEKPAKRPRKNIKEILL
jgi:nitroreductase